DRVLRRELDHAVGSERHQPLRVERDFGLVAVENQKYLVGVRLRVVRDFIGGQRWTRGVAARRIADHSGEIADQKDDAMTELLQLAKLVELDRMAEMQIGTRRVEAFLDRQRNAARKLCNELRFDQKLFGAAFEDGQ